MRINITLNICCKERKGEIFMNVFKIKNSGIIDLTVENYEDATNKSKPYYQTQSNGMDAHYAICPICNNPVIIVNLYKTDYVDKKYTSVSLHARHCKKTITGIAKYNKKNYLNCPLHNETSFGRRILRANNLYNLHLESLIKKNKKTIKSHIRNILGINFSNQYLDHIIDTYLINRNYQYEHTNEFNLPYSIIYTSEALDIFGRYLQNSTLGVEIKDSIINNSNQFIISNNKIDKISNEYADINIQLCHHRKTNGIWHLTLKLTETVNGNTATLFEKEIKLATIVL